MKTSISAKYTPGIIALLPIYYVTWSDSILSPTEIKVIRSNIGELDFLTPDERNLLTSWLDPAVPPEPETFQEWIEVMSTLSEDLPDLSAMSLADLGVTLADRLTPPGLPSPWTDAKVRATLKTVEEALRISSNWNKALLFSKILPGQQTLEIERKTGFTPEKMQHFLEAEDGLLLNRVKTLLQDQVFNHPAMQLKEDYREEVLRRVKILADQGLSRYAFPEKYGGHDDVAASITIFEALAYHDLSVLIKFGVQFGLFGGALYGLGTEKHHEAHLRAMMNLELPGCFAMTETGHGSNVRNLETTATYKQSSGTFIIHSPSYTAGKEYIGNAMHARMAIVFAQLKLNHNNHGVHAFLVPLRNKSGELFPGVQILDCGYKMGLNGVDNGRIWFDNVEIPYDNLLDKYGGVSANGQYFSPIKNDSKRFFTMLGALVAGRVSIGIAANTAAKNALTVAVKYALKRRQFAPATGEPEMIIMDYPTHQRRLIPKLAKTYALHFALQHLKHFYAKQYRENSLRAVETLAAGLKAYASEHCTETIQECREACGGKGYLSENRIPDLKADTDIFTTFEGDNTVLYQLVAKSLLSEFRDHFNDTGYFGVVRFLAKRLTTSISELNPVTIRNTNSDHLLSEEFHLAAFQYREQQLLFSLSQRMRNYLRRKITPYQAFLRCQTHMITLAVAHVENLVLERFYIKIRSVADNECKLSLLALARIYALHTIEKHKGWYLENEYLAPSKTKAIRRVVDQLCKEVRPDLHHLIDAFNIPKTLSGAEIL